MELIDTHTHLYLQDFKSDIKAIMDRATAQGVSNFFLPAIDSSEMKNLLALEKDYPGTCHAMMGLHPCSVKGNFKEELIIVEEALSKRKFAAIGEIGLDLHWDRTYLAQQYESFHTQINLALKYDVPIVIHSRDATDEAIAVVEEYRGKKLKGIFHCFGGSLEQATRIIHSGFTLGIGGVVTYKRSGLDEVLKDVDLQYLVLETDAPYLAPVPFRGKRNESSYLQYIVAKIAEIKIVSVEEVARVTTANARRIFKF